MRGGFVACEAEPGLGQLLLLPSCPAAAPAALLQLHSRCTGAGAMVPHRRPSRTQRRPPWRRHQTAPGTRCTAPPRPPRSQRRAGVRQAQSPPRRLPAGCGRQARGGRPWEPTHPRRPPRWRRQPRAVLAAPPTASTHPLATPAGPARSAAGRKRSCGAAGLRGPTKALLAGSARHLQRGCPAASAPFWWACGARAPAAALAAPRAASAQAAAPGPHLQGRRRRHEA
jgi:hypothetical protein